MLVLEDLCCAAEAWAAACWKMTSGDGDHRAKQAGIHYCPVQHAVMELRSIVRGGGGHDDKDMLWLLGFGSYASYTSCRSGQPSLETVLELDPIALPDGSLALSLSLASDSEITHSGVGRVTATAASEPSWLCRCQDQDLPVLTGSELTLSFSSPACSSQCGFTSKSLFEPWHSDPIAKSYDQLSLANPNPGYSNSVSKSNPSDGATVRRRPKFTELTAENLKILCSALETRVPRHRDIAPGIASAVLQRRSGVTRTTRPTSSATWFLFQGRDNDGKMAMARELARLVFGSYAEFTCIAAAAASKLTPDHHSIRRQRSPDNGHGGRRCMQIFYEAIRNNPHRVVLVDGVEHDSELEAGIMNAMASGTVRGCHGGLVSLEDSIVVVCCEVFESRTPGVSSLRPMKQRIMSEVDGKQVEDDGTERVVVPRFSLDLNSCAIDVQRGEGTSLHNAMEILNAMDGVFFF